MNRIATTFEALRRRGEKALVGFVTAGDPDPDRSLAIVRAMCAAGAEVTVRSRLVDAAARQRQLRSSAAVERARQLRLRPGAEPPGLRASPALGRAGQLSPLE